MGRSCRIAVLLGFALPGVVASAWAQEPVATLMCTSMPVNVQMPLPLQLALDQLLVQSSTLRRQCAAIAAASTRAHLVIQVARPDMASCRARASFAWTSAGRLDVRIDVPFTRDFPELIAHELEHVVEQIEGLNLRRLSEQPASGVEGVATGTFETARARDAGRRAALEVQTQVRLVRAQEAFARASADAAALALMPAPRALATIR